LRFRFLLGGEGRRRGGKMIIQGRRMVEVGKKSVIGIISLVRF
jgi:hypothetical protein